MHPQLKAVIDEFHSASERLQRLVETVPGAQWPQRPEADRWSVAECIAHLNLTGAAYLPLLHEALEEGRRREDPPPAKYRRDPIGWLLWRTMGPPVRRQVRTSPAFIPSANAAPSELVEEFERLQAEQVACVEAADGLPLQKVRVHSPFNSRVKYNLYACLTILPRHQHRHLWQAEQVREALRLEPA